MLDNIMQYFCFFSNSQVVPACANIRKILLKMIKLSPLLVHEKYIMCSFNMVRIIVPCMVMQGPYSQFLTGAGSGGYEVIKN